MKHNYLKMASLVAALALTLTACRKERITPSNPEISGTKGVYVLCEGSFSGGGDSFITYYNLENNTTEADFYKKANGTDLGKNANDLKVYGSKMYAIITGTGAANTSFVDIISVATGKSLKRIAFNNAQPRSVAFADGKAYVSNYNGKISRIDTANMVVESELQLTNGTNNATYLENVAITNNKLYVAGASYFGATTSYNNKLIVVNLATFTKTKEITVVYNPQRLSVTNSGELLLASWGDYASVSAALQKINTATDEVSQTTNKADLSFVVSGKNQVLAGVVPFSALPTVNVVNTATTAVGNSFVTDNTNILTPYGASFNSFDNSVLITDANYYGSTGKAFGFTADGKKKFEFNTGANPQAAVFNYTYK